jgi:hypothetical protein
MNTEFQLLVEHDSVPGMEYKDKLFVENVGFLLNECELNETTSSSGGKSLLAFKGKFQEAEAVNKNKRMYPFSVLDENIKRLTETVSSRGLVGELDHPTDSIIHFKECSHAITKLWWDGNNLMGEGQILNTPCGKVLKSLIEDGIRVGISSRGVGNGKVNEEGILVIGESYKLITFDAVADPSTYAAFQQKVAISKHETVMPQKYNNIAPKNEATSIYNGNVLVAVLGSVIKNKTSELKARLFDG